MRHILLCRCLVTDWPRIQPEKDSGSSPASSPWRISTTPHQHWNANWTELKTTQQFTYLGCTNSSDAKKIDKEIDSRLANWSQQLLRQTIQTSVEQQKFEKQNKTKIRVYRAVVLTTLLYGSETWVTYQRHICLLERFHQRCLHTILNIHWNDFITNVEVLQLAEVSSIEAMVLPAPIGWSCFQNGRPSPS